MYALSISAVGTSNGLQNALAETCCTCNCPTYASSVKKTGLPCSSAKDGLTETEILEASPGIITVIFTLCLYTGSSLLRDT